MGWQSVWSASRAYETTVVSLVPPGEEATPLPAVFGENRIRAVRVPHRPPDRLSAAWNGLFGPWPYTLGRFRNPDLPGVLRAVISEIRPRFALVNHLHMASYADDLDQVPMVLREHNLEFVWMKRYAQRLGLSTAGIYARTQVGRLLAAETALTRKAALVLAIQPEEAAELKRIAPGTRIEVLPVGVDLDRFAEPHPGEPPVVLLAGSFAWPPNVEGAIQFMRDGWPLVVARVPRARLRIVGKDPPRRLRRAADRIGVEVLGYVDSIAEEFARATVFVIPLWTGAGVRVRIVEAMAARVPIVATRLAAEGLGLTAGEHYAAGDTAGELGGQVAALLRSPELREVLRRRGRAIAEERWGLDAVAELQNRLCAGLELSHRVP